MSIEPNKKEILKPKIKLPFNDKKSDIGEWAFDHRVGLCVTVIGYLLFGIVFVCSKIIVGGEQHTQGFYIELSDIAALEERKEQLEKEIQERQDFDWGSVSNRASNDLSLEERASQKSGSTKEMLSGEAAKAQETMEANRKAYQDALDQIQSDREKGREKSQEEAAERRDIKQSGNVTVAYSFASPVRHAQNLIVPAYQCQGGGEVVVEAQLNQKGVVIAATILRGGDKCMQETALRAAKGSSFNATSDAPEPHTGTITYIFIPQ